MCHSRPRMRFLLAQVKSAAAAVSGSSLAAGAARLRFHRLPCPPTSRIFAPGLHNMTLFRYSSTLSSTAAVAPMPTATAAALAGIPAQPLRVAHIVALPIPLPAKSPGSATAQTAKDDDHLTYNIDHHLHPALHKHDHLWLFLSPPTLPAAPPEPNHHRHARFTRGWWAHKLSHEWPVRVAHEWSELSQPDAANWKRKIHAMGSRLLAALPWHELVAKKWIAPVEHVVLYHPASVESMTAHRQLAKFVVTRLDSHVKWRKISALGLPFSVMAGILPGPNLPLLYNAFRVYSHHIAAANLASVHASVHDGALSTIEVADLDPLLSQLSLASGSLPLDLNTPEFHSALSSALAIVGSASTIPDHLQPTRATDKKELTETQPLLATFSDQLVSDVLHALRQEAKKHARAGASVNQP